MILFSVELITLESGRRAVVGTIAGDPLPRVTEKHTLRVLAPDEVPIDAGLAVLRVLADVAEAYRDSARARVEDRTVKNEAER